MQFKKLISFLDETLNIGELKNIDTSLNGLQISVDDDKKEIKKIGFAVSASMEVFEKAKEENCDLIVVHHGLIWEKAPIKNILRKRIKFLLENNIALYAAHLPLDKHDKYGNNIIMAKMLGLNVIEKFGSYHGIDIGFMGLFDKEIELKELLDKVKKITGQRPKTINFGKDRVKKIAIVSGGGGSCMDEAIEKNADVFLTGEIVLSNYDSAKDSSINLVYGGHYATETLGVKAIERLINEKFNIETVFINIENYDKF